MISDRDRTDVTAQDFGPNEMLVLFILKALAYCIHIKLLAHFNTLRTGDADLRF